MDNWDFIDKKSLSERDICTKFITPAIKDVAGWDLMRFSEELTLEKIFVKGKRASAWVAISLVRSGHNTFQIGNIVKLASNGRSSQK